MTAQEQISAGELLKLWDEEMPLLSMDQTMRQMLFALQQGEQLRLLQEQQISKLTTAMAELRARMRRMEEGGGHDVLL